MSMFNHIQEAQQIKITAIEAIQAKKDKTEINVSVIRFANYFPDKVTKENIDKFKQGMDKFVRKVEKEVNNGKDVHLN